MKIHYTIDDSAARLPLSIRSEEGVWDRAAELRSAPGVQLVELTTQHMLNTGTMLIDELAHYFEAGSASESDPYALALCYSNREQLEDLLRDLRGTQNLASFREVEALFPVTFMRDLHFTLALTTVGVSAFGYVRSFKDSEGEEYHGMVVNLAQARPHLETVLGQFSLSLLVDVIRRGFFNHMGFRIAYAEYTGAIGRSSDRPLDKLKDALLSRGIAWYLSYQNDLDFYTQMLDLNGERLASYARHWNSTVESIQRRSLSDDTLEEWLRRGDFHHPGELYVDALGFHAARTVFAAQGNKGLREAIMQGGDQFLAQYNACAEHKLKT